ncbi:MAG TPA: protein kinase, partial [Kofleriaceae bacterium]|nr:protein kinase [Kofleriaceae bacterium]
MFADARDSAGDLLGRLVDNRYKILEAMASGSMGAVFKAERVPVGKLVAIKFLHSSFANDAEFLSRFERETRVMSKLAHPNCVSVVDFGVWDGTPYLVMEYVNGQTLRAVLDAGPLQPLRALGIAKQIAAGLAHAHAQGIVHRDVKPANIMISEEIGTGEHVRILDFGLARLRGAVGSDATQTNVVVGTPNYMAPEQTVGGGTIDARTDVYAVGIVLFEMIAGERPFQADDTLALLGMHRAAPIPKLADRIDRTVTLPAGLQELIDTAMAKAPEDRFQSAIELAAAVDALTAHRPSVTGAIASARRTGTAPTVIDRTIERPTQRASRLPLVLLALLVLGGAAAGAWYLKQRRDTPTQPTTRPGAAALVLPDAAAVAEVTRDAPTVVEPAPDAAANELVVTNPVDLSESEPVPEEAANPAPQDPSKPAVDDEAEDA